ncbi:MAG: hypothetical protein ACRENE_14955 [Polyangiaceae bacterium]
MAAVTQRDINIHPSVPPRLHLQAAMMRQSSRFALDTAHCEPCGANDQR